MPNNATNEDQTRIVRQYQADFEYSIPCCQYIFSCLTGKPNIEYIEDRP